MNDKIALMARMRAGKDHVAQYLRTYYGHERFAFADKMKESAFLAFPGAFADGNKPRQILQQFGQKVREINSNVWIDACMHDIQQKDPQRVVITDLRLPNEHAALKAAGFTIVKIHVSRETQIRRILAAGDKCNPADLDHETESYIDQLPADYVLHNDEDNADVLRQVDEMMQLGVIFR